MQDIIVRPMKPDEIDKIASLISKGYYDDIFFKWVVDHEGDRLKIVTDYYKVYLNVKGSIVHVAQTPSKEIIGATIWLPHDVDISIYEEIDKVVGVYARKFKKVADKSHYSEPPMIPFYQLVGYVIDKTYQGFGLGSKLLKHQIDYFDELGIPTYLEASTPYYGGGVYGKFGYQPIGELMTFDNMAVLYPCWRDAKKKETIEFGEYNWRVLTKCSTEMLVLSVDVIEDGKYHDDYEDTTWSSSSIRQYLNDNFYNQFTDEEKSQIVDIQVITKDNPWFFTNGGDITTDKIFLLSVDEVIKYLGNNGELRNSNDKFFIDDVYNDNRRATTKENLETRWLLRTPGNSPNMVSLVTNDGRISLTGDFVNRYSTDLFKVGIRPAMWIKAKGE